MIDHGLTLTELVPPKLEKNVQNGARTTSRPVFRHHKSMGYL